MKTKLHIPEDIDKVKFNEKISEILSRYDASQIIHIEFMQREFEKITSEGLVRYPTYAAYILVREDE